MLMLIISSNNVVWINYSSVGCFTCHRIPSIRVSDTLFIVGSYHYNYHLTPFILAFDSSLNIKWYRAFNHNLDNLGINDIIKIDDSLLGVVGGHGRNYTSDNPSQCPNQNCSFFGIFNIKTKNFLWAKYRQALTKGEEPGMGIAYDGNNFVLAFDDSCSSVIMKINFYGSLIWQKRYNLNGVCDKIMSIKYDGSGYVALLIRNNGQNNDIALMKIDNNGNVLWSKGYDFYAHEISQNFTIDNDGYTIVGTRCLTAGPLCGSQLGDDDIIVLKTDFNGNIKFSKIYSSNVMGWNSEDRGYNITIENQGIDVMPNKCLDIGQPVDPITGQIKVNFNQIYSTCTPCVRVNFIYSQAFNSISDLFNVYDQIINNFVDHNIRVYGLVGHEAVKTWVGYLLSYENPNDMNAVNNWINEYVSNFTSIVIHFKDKIKVFESINEPNGYVQEVNGYWIHPKWFSKILADLYQSVKINNNIKDVKLISGPLLTDDISKGDRYIDSTYWYGKNVWNWNWIKSLTGSYPLDGIGMHIYVLLNSTNSSAISNAITNNINLVWNKVIFHEGQNTNKKIWVSEFGWESSLVGQNGQSNNMITEFNILNNDNRIALATWFQLKDFVVDNSLKTWGIYDINNNPKQSYWTFKNLNNSYCNGFYPPNNYLISGFVRANNNLSYPLVIKIDNNGNLVWAKAWLNPPLNVNSNQAKGIISYANDRFFLISFLGSQLNAVGGFAIVKSYCTQNINFSSLSFNPFSYSIIPSMSNSYEPIYNLYFSSYQPSLNISQGCYITPISNYEIIRDCDFEILSRNGKLEISSKNKHDFSVYDIQGRLIYRKLIIGKEILNMKGGIYIISVNRKFYKIIVS